MNQPWSPYPGYNGWTDFETWLTVVHIQNNYYGERPFYIQNEIYGQVFKGVLGFKEWVLSHLMKCSSFKSEIEIKGFNFYESANWDEIAESYVNDEPDCRIYLVNTAKDMLKLFKAELDCIILPNLKLERELYKECKAIIESYGYKYSVGKFKKKGATAADDLQKMIDGVEVLSARKQFDFFPTPPDVVKIAQELLEHDGESPILEPSCGNGDLVAGLEKYARAIEINPDCISELKNRGIEVIGSDFEKEKPQRFDYVIMNPPFSKRRDAKHVVDAFNNWLSDGGVLVAITSGGIMSVKDKPCTQFQELYAKYGMHQETIESGAFKDSGTNIVTMIHKFVKPVAQSSSIPQFNLFGDFA